MASVKYSKDEQAVVTLSLNRDEKRNALNGEMGARLLASLEQAEREEARVVILRANPGVPVWCAGHDLAELEPDNLLEDNTTLKVCRHLQSMPIPVVAMVEGSVYAAGMLLLLYSDMVVASQNAEVAITSKKLGIPLPAELYAYWLRVMGLHKTKEMLFTASTLTAHDAYVAGLYNHVVEASELEATTQTLVERLLACSPAGIANAKQQLNVLAAQTGLADGQLAELQQRNEQLLADPDVRQRIAKVFDSLRSQ
ncbi:enoyl-CoA hydratase-related protein [Aeoliella sp. ICT_H6.2]|uniref:Enoyl-CoA hydratase-related protein n=1 Tax=Aeoliella straminimaris TaxID=2954799 RepID=A0A9X2JG83_9BACT|nr:enoyl-CoA hydratase-related protein [Aeoliella straminimaris]MCO6043243.1 enoyl-CoA hydratase-related protein [Aeoliella straminimaris]